MAASRDKIAEWFDKAVETHATHMIVVCDMFDFEDFPVYVGGVHPLAKEGPCKEVVRLLDNGNMRKVMEVYSTSISKEKQLEPGTRVWNVD